MCEEIKAAKARFMGRKTDQKRQTMRIDSRVAIARDEAPESFKRSRIRLRPMNDPTCASDDDFELQDYGRLSNV